MIEKLIFALEIIGTIAFAVSGAMVALGKKMDVLGVLALGLVTAVGGGIVRDIILGVTPPTAFRKPVYAITALIVALIVFLPFIRKRINPKSNLLLIMDSVGLGVFTVIGVGGGVIRDVFALELPSIFVHRFYACASLIGAIICTYLWRVNETLALAAGAIIVVVLRLLAAKFRWNLPK